MSNKRIFRKVALERLSSPEQLDQLMHVTTPTGWIALLGLGLILVTAVLWAVFGSIPSTIHGSGILIKSGGVIDVVSPGEGPISSIYMAVGDSVTRGQTVARIAQPELVDMILKARGEVTELEEKHRAIDAFGNRNMELQARYLEKARHIQEASIKVSEDRLAWLEEKRRYQEQLFNQGLLSRQDLLDGQFEIEEVRKEIADLKNQLNKNEADLLGQTNDTEQRLFDAQMDINEAKRKLSLLEDQLELNSKVISPRTGRILEIRSREGNIVRKGDPIVSLELEGDDNQDLNAVIYMAPTEGKKCKPGMTMRVTPTTIKREEFGYILAIVTEVSEFPATREGMLRVLGNNRLVDEFQSKGAPIAVRAVLLPDPDTHSGFKWSSPKGPPSKIHSGTLCAGSVVVRRQPPITLVIPYLRDRLGL